jgi:hypothetical protein
MTPGNQLLIVQSSRSARAGRATGLDRGRIHQPAVLTRAHAAVLLHQAVIAIADAPCGLERVAARPRTATVLDASHRVGVTCRVGHSTR